MKLLRRAAAVIFPPKCIFCQGLLDYNASLNICGECIGQLPFLEAPSLRVLQSGESSFCDEAVSVFRYTGKVKVSLIRFKFYGKPSYYRTYARLMADKLAKSTDVRQFHMVMSVPLHAKRELTRGYNQARLISGALSRELKLPECSRFIKRKGSTEAQSLLDKQKRSRNVKGAFVVSAPEKVKGKRILLVDDILTTGATLEECSRMLKESGAAKVAGVVVATGRKIEQEVYSCLR